MQHRSIDWLSSGAATFLAGTAITLLLNQKVPTAIAAGLVTAASGIGTAALYSRNDKIRIKVLEQQLGNKAAAEQKIAQEKQLRATVEQLTKQETSLKEQLPQAEAKLSQIRGQYAQLQGRGQALKAEQEEIKQQITNFTNQEQDLNRRIAVIQQQNPDLKTREELQCQIEEFRQNSSHLKGQLEGLHLEINRLEEERRSCLSVEAELATKQADLNQLSSRVATLQAEAQQLAEKSAQLELLRVTYDGLFQERERIETRIRHREPEVKRLEDEQRRLLKEIQAQEAEYAKANQKRQEIQELEKRLQILRREEQESEAQTDRLKHEHTDLQARIKQLQEDLRKLEAQQGDTEQLVNKALQALREPLWTNFPTIQQPRLSEETFINGFIQYVKARGFGFSPRVIRAFHTSLKVQGISALVVLAGISGTGKSELPRLYSEYIGAQFLMLAVQPRWDSPQDLLGFYNYMENKFKPTPLIQGIYQYQHSMANDDRIVLVLLDEMNLARVEYYFSEFLSKLESRRNHRLDTYLDIDLGSLPVRSRDRRFPIPEQFLFIGTMNEDETTQSLSDKVLDRANVLTFGKPDRLQLGSNGSQPTPSGQYLTYSQFTSWAVDPQSPEVRPVVERVTQILDKANLAMEAMGHPFAHRVYQAIAWYVVNYPGARDLNSEAFRFAMADQFAQKLLPKLRGVMVQEQKQPLDDLERIIAEIGDSVLLQAFNKASQGHYGQFHWKGLVYKNVQGEG